MNETEMYRVCDFPHPEAEDGEVLAVNVREQISLNGDRYELDTCDDCSARLHGQFMAIADHGRLVGRATVFDKPKVFRSATVSTEPTLVFTEPAAPAPADRRRGPRQELPRTALRWRLTKHAEERIEQRGFTKEQVLWACERPETVLPNLNPITKDTTEQRVRGVLCAVVNPDTYEVLTVKRFEDRQQQKGA